MGTKSNVLYLKAYDIIRKCISIFSTMSPADEPFP